MSERNLLKLLKSTEYLDASRQAFTAAEEHRKAAKLVAKEGHYGIPVSNLILSTEQTVVGILIYAEHLGVKIKNTPGTHLFFTDHIIRHQLAVLISTVYPIIKLMYGFVEKIREDIFNGVKPKDTNSYFDLTSKKEAVTLFRNLEEMYEWWDNANIQKNRGFYVDYSNRLETPMQVTQTEYEQALRIVENFQSQIFNIVQYIESLPDYEKVEFSKNIENFKLSETLSGMIEARKEEKKHSKPNKLPKLPSRSSTDKKNNNPSPE